MMKDTIKETEDIEAWKNLLCSWIDKINIKISILPQVIYRFNMIPIKTPIIRFRKSVAKIHMETRDLKQLQQP